MLRSKQWAISNGSPFYLFKINHMTVSDFMFYWILGGASLFMEIIQFKQAKLVYVCMYIISSKLASKDEKMEALKKLPVGCLPNILYMIYATLGLFTFQWPLFLIIEILAFLPKSKIVDINLGTLAYKIDSAICLVIITFTILNAAHYRIPIGNYVYSWFNH